MRLAPLVSAVTTAAFLTATMPLAAHAQSAAPRTPTTFRASIDRAADQAAAQAPARRRAPVRKEQMMGGGGGGGGMMLMTLIGTVVGLAGTYFLVKEMRKQNDEAAKSQ